MLLAISAQQGLVSHQMDIGSAFLNGEIDEEVFVQQLEGFEVRNDGVELVCKLKKSLNGIKQSPKCWNVMVDTILKTIDFEQTNEDPCLYYHHDKELMYFLVYVDDLVIAGKDETNLKRSRRV